MSDDQAYWNELAKRRETARAFEIILSRKRMEEGTKRQLQRMLADERADIQRLEASR